MKNDKEQILKQVNACPYCKGTNIIKKGIRKKKLEKVQVYFCKNCQRKFTPQLTKNKTYPLKIIIEVLTRYNRLNKIEEITECIKQQYGFNISKKIISHWIESFSTYIPFLRMRSFIKLKYDRRKIIQESKMFHKQIYHFMYHPAKLKTLLLENYRNSKIAALYDFLELVIPECPHQLFKEDIERASTMKDNFNLEGVKIVSKINYACKIANFVMQAVTNNKMRHQVLQEFMLINDSVTVATEVPVLLTEDDLAHYKYILGFDIPFNTDTIITGHIDILQLRNGIVHIMDYKPSARKVKPVDQLTLYALALSRLTTLKLHAFKCACFDKDNYYTMSFFPCMLCIKRQRRRGNQKLRQRRQN